MLVPGAKGDIFRCNEVETEAIPIYICPRNRNCNTAILNLACSVFKMDLLLENNCSALLGIKCPELKQET